MAAGYALHIKQESEVFPYILLKRYLKDRFENLIGTGMNYTIMERPAAITLLHQYVCSDALSKHCLATGAIMRAVAGFFSQNPARWEVIGILHFIDFEYVKGDMKQHGVTGAKLLKTAGIPDDIRDVVERHNHFLYTGSYDSPVEIALPAADSASGLIIACALVKSGHITGVSVKTITRKAKKNPLRPVVIGAGLP